jgi:predicted dehydrogenase
VDARKKHLNHSRNSQTPKSGHATMNLGVVGCGEVANEHLRALRRVRGIYVAALCDKDADTLSRMSQKWNVRATYTDYSKMLNEQDLSIVSILTPPASHVPLAIEAVERGVNVLIEKPLAMTAAEIQPLIEKLRGSSVKVTVDHIMLFSRIAGKVLKLVKSGGIGDVLGAKIEYLGTQKDSMAATESHWSHNLLGGRLGEMLPHPVYILQSIVGNQVSVESVVAEKRGRHSWMPCDELKVLLGCENKLWGEIYVSFNAPRDMITADVYGTRRILKVDMINQSLIQLGNRSLGKTDSARDLLDQSCNLFLTTMMNTVRYLTIKPMGYPLRNLYTSFIDNVVRGTDPIVTPQTALATVKTTEEICKRIPDDHDRGWHN